MKATQPKQENLSVIGNNSLFNENKALDKIKLAKLIVFFILSNILSYQISLYLNSTDIKPIKKTQYSPKVGYKRVTINARIYIPLESPSGSKVNIISKSQVIIREAYLIELSKIEDMSSSNYYQVTLEVSEKLLSKLFEKEETFKIFPMVLSHSKINNTKPQETSNEIIF
ncbi:hypothetical protein OAT67_04010 [Bacteriovoracaceae bacterium]|nr:hypothetical protein [Bacteriovoracaceae bacterium]